VRLALALSATAGLVIGTAGTAHATFPGANGKLVGADPFSTAGTQIRTMNADGTGLTAITSTGSGVFNVEPEWSADGARIAFLSGSGFDFGLHTIHVMDADGGNRVDLGVNGRSPTWSPDGTRIAFGLHNVADLWIMNADGTAAAPVAGTAPAIDPDWSPDGTRIVFAGPSGVRVLDVGTQAVTTLVPADGASFLGPEWSSDGTKVFYHRNDGAGSSEVWSVAADGTGAAPLTSGAGFDGDPAPSPDGTRVAFVRLSDTAIMNPDGTGQGPVGARLDDLDWQAVEASELLPLQVGKTAAPAYSIRHAWTVDKWASAKAGWDAKDQSLAVPYSVRVKHQASAPTGITVTGQISIHNPNATAVAVSSVEDDTPGATSCTTAAAPTVPAGATVYVPYTCHFSALPSGVVTNTATVRWNDGQADTSASAKVPVDFAAAEVVHEGPRAVRVTDTLDGDATRTLAGELTGTRTFTYTRYLKAAPGECRTWHNTARIIGLEDHQNGVRVAMNGKNYAFTATDQEWVRVCAPAPPKDDPKDDPTPPTVIVGGDKDPQPAKVVDADNPKGPVVSDPEASKGTLRVSKSASVRRAEVGDLVTWTIRVSNAGKADLSKVALLDRLPRHLVVATDAQVATGRSAKVRGTLVRIAVGDLGVGQTRTYSILTRVVARPHVTPTLVADARKLGARERKVVMSRTRRGIVCNRVAASAADTGTVGAIACLRVVKAPDVQPVAEEDRR
jgi:uncharacterized repeat protein (TIGR01451 family)